MNEQAIQEQYQHIVTLLKQQRLKEAQSQLEAFLWNSGDWTLRNRLEQAQTSYQYMLQYMRQGIDDPERQKLYRQILTETWEVADQARLSLLDGVSTHYYHSPVSYTHLTLVVSSEVATTLFSKALIDKMRERFLMAEVPRLIFVKTLLILVSVPS